MTRNEAIDWLCRLRSSIDSHLFDVMPKEWFSSSIEALGFAIDSLMVDETYQLNWIPVSERLPKEREWYLAVFKEIDTGYQLIPRVADYIGNGENKWQIIDEDGLGQEYRSILECVAWMPLLEPYKSQEKSDKEQKDD